VPAILAVLASLLRSHGESAGRHAKGLILWGALIGAFTAVAGIYFVALLTYLLALWLGTALALAVIAGGALLLSVLALVMLRAEKRRLVAAHREHVEQERLAVRAAVAELVAAGKLSGSMAAVSATVAAVIVVILRRLRGGDGAGPSGGGASGADPSTADQAGTGADRGDGTPPGAGGAGV
jgi:hypothetical protein